MHNGGRTGEHGISVLRVTKGFDEHEGVNFTDERHYKIETVTSDERNSWVDYEGMDWLFSEKEQDLKTEYLLTEFFFQRYLD